MHPVSLKYATWFFATYGKRGDKILDVGSRESAKTTKTYRRALSDCEDFVKELAKGENGAAHLQKLYDSLAKNYTGLDIVSGRNVDIVVKDPYRWTELKDNTYDLIICGQAFEHIEFFWEVFKEMARVLKPKGYMCVIAPSHCKIHKFPVDCWRFLPDGMRALGKYAGLKVLKAHCRSPSYKFYVDDKGRAQPNDTVGVFQK